MSLRVRLSYEERILNALARVRHKKTDDVIVRTKREFDAIREILQPLYDELDQLRKELGRKVSK